MMMLSPLGCAKVIILRSNNLLAAPKQSAINDEYTVEQWWDYHRATNYSRIVFLTATLTLLATRVLNREPQVERLMIKNQVMLRQMRLTLDAAKQFVLLLARPNEIRDMMGATHSWPPMSENDITTVWRRMLMLRHQDDFSLLDSYRLMTKEQVAEKILTINLHGFVVDGYIKSRKAFK